MNRSALLGILCAAILAPIAIRGACSSATASPTDQWADLAEQFERYDTLQFAYTTKMPITDATHTLVDPTGKGGGFLWIDRNSGKMYIHSDNVRRVFPDGTSYGMYGPHEPFPEPFPALILTVGNALHHVLTTGFEGCEATAASAPFGMRDTTGFTVWDKVSCDAFPKGLGDVLYIEHDIRQDGRPTLMSLAFHVADIHVRVHIGGMIWDEPLTEGHHGPEPRWVDIQYLHPYRLTRLPGRHR